MNRRPKGTATTMRATKPTTLGRWTSLFLLSGPAAKQPAGTTQTERDEVRALMRGRNGMRRVAESWRTHERTLRQLARAEHIKPKFPRGRFFAEAVAHRSEAAARD